MEGPSNPGHSVFLWLTGTEKCVSYNFFRMSFPWSLWFASCKILSLFHFCSGCWGSLGDFYESIGFAAHGVPQEVTLVAGVTLVGYFVALWRYLETHHCGGIFSAKLINIVIFSGLCQMDNFYGKKRGEGSKSRTVGMLCPTFMPAGLCRVEDASILVFLNVKDVDLKCRVIFRHYLEVWTCNTQLLGALKRADTNRGQSKYKIFLNH